jgi:hypothetical protein
MVPRGRKLSAAADEPFLAVVWRRLLRARTLVALTRERHSFLVRRGGIRELFN